MSMSARRKARVLACQAVYQWQMTQEDLQQIYQQFIEDNASKEYDEDYFSVVFFGVCKQQEALDCIIEPELIDKKLIELTQIELALLRIGAFELLNSHDVPVNVVLTETVRISKKFGSTDGYKFVNAVLDKVVATQNLRMNDA